MARNPWTSWQSGAIHALRRCRAAPGSRPIPGLFVDQSLMAGHAMLPISATERIDAVPHTKIDNWPTGRQPVPPRGIVRTKPRAHPRAIRTTNLPERLFVEERRRLKIIPNAFGEKAVLKLMFGAMIRAAERWRAIRVCELECRQMRAVFRLSPDLPGAEGQSLFLRRDLPGLSGISGIPRGARPSREARPGESCGRSRPHLIARSRTA